MMPKLREKIVFHAVFRLMQKSNAFFQQTFAGSLATKVNQLTDAVPEIVQICIDKFFYNFLAISIAVVTLSCVNIFFGLLMFLWCVSFLVGAFYYSKRLSPLAARWSECGAIIVGGIVDIFSNILSVKLFATSQFEKSKLHSYVDDAIIAERNLHKANLLIWVIYDLAFLTLQILNFYLLCKGYQEKWLTLGDFALVIGINVSIIDYLWMTAKEFSQFSKVYGRIEQALQTISENMEIKDDRNAKDLQIERGEIVFKHVKFRYPGTDPLFHKKSVTIHPGQKVGLVGHSGSGKSTFVSLILRLYDIDEGQILIDGQDIQKATQDSLHKHIALIPQDPLLFHRSLLENIRYGDIKASYHDVIEAAKKAHAHEFIKDLPQGYESLVGERGIKLSGGQRQRIAIARAFLKNAPILILDEATSQLDSETERLIQESLWHLMQNKTTIVIAHRLSTLLNMDRILVFDKGKIIEDGPHTELIKRCGQYKIFWELQHNGFIKEQ
jgi:ATP-binding cassette subfamily B protein